LHEVGKLYILMRAKDHPALLGSDAFQSVLADWHTRIGRLVIEAWDLPADLAAAVGEHEHRGLEAVAPAALTDVVAVANFLAEASANGRIDGLYDRCPDFGALSLEQPTFDWLLRAGKVDIHLLTVAFGT
jgi:HD-like signal output (HDOD) protein